MLHKIPLEIGNMFIIYCSNSLWFWDYYFALFQSIAMPSQRTPCFQESSKQCFCFCPRLPCILAPQKCFLFGGGFDVSINCIYVGLNPCSPVGISLRHFTVLISLFHRQGTGWRALCLSPALASLLVWGFGAAGFSGIGVWVKHTPKLQNLAVLLQLNYLKELPPCTLFFLRITNPNEEHASFILPKASGTKYNFDWFECTTLSVLNWGNAVLL